MKKAWIPPHNAQVWLYAECLQVVKSHSKVRSFFFFLPAMKNCYFKQTLFHLFQFMLNKKKRGAQRAAALAPGLLKLDSKWESLNRAPMNITTSLDLKSPGIFVGIAMRFARRNSPLSAVLLLHSRHRSVHVPTRTFCAKLHHVTVRLFLWFLWTRLFGLIMNAAALIVTFHLNLNWQATAMS